jgi:hypothetical protein
MELWGRSESGANLATSELRCKRKIKKQRGGLGNPKPTSSILNQLQHLASPATKVLKPVSLDASQCESPTHDQRQHLRSVSQIGNRKSKIENVTTPTARPHSGHRSTGPCHRPFSNTLRTARDDGLYPGRPSRKCRLCAGRITDLDPCRTLLAC